MLRFRPRISLLTVILLTTIVGLSIVTAQLWREVDPLRQQVRSMRAELGLLNIDDPMVAQAIQLGTNSADHWKWRIYLPPQGNYELLVYSGTIPPHGVHQSWYNAIRQSASGMSSTIAPGEFVLHVELFKEDSQWNVITTRGEGLNRSVMSVQGDWLSQMTSRGVTSSVSADNAASFPPGQPIHLMTLHEPVVTRNGASTSFTTPTGPANGIVVWIEQHMPATNSPAATAPP